MDKCRLCLQPEQGQQKLISLFKNPEESDTTIDLIIKIRECVSIEISMADSFPTTVCTFCIQKVIDWSLFKDTCLRSNQLLIGSQNNESEIVENKSHLKCNFKFNLKENNKGNDVNIDEDANSEEENENGQKSYSCEICSETFTNCFDYLDHQKMHNGEFMFQCDLCLDIFSTRDALLEHDKTHKQPCPKCEKLISKNNLSRHLVKHTEKNMCSHCSNCFDTRGALSQHIISVHTDCRDHICHVCEKKFSSKYLLKNHIRTHSDERNYKCKLCDYRGKTSSAVFLHMSSHDNEECACMICSKIFKSGRRLTAHLRRAHSDNKKYSCSYCNKKFVEKFMLTVHLRCHTGVKPYECTLCNKSFVRSDYLKGHMETHGERVWFDCDKCQKKFSSKKTLSRHQTQYCTHPEKESEIIFD